MRMGSVERGAGEATEELVRESAVGRDRPVRMLRLAQVINLTARASSSDSTRSPCFFPPSDMPSGPILTPAAADSVAPYLRLGSPHRKLIGLPPLRPTQRAQGLTKRMPGIALQIQWERHLRDELRLEMPGLWMCQPADEGILLHPIRDPRLPIRKSVPLSATHAPKRNAEPSREETPQGESKC
jgi:hypothetical protein